MIKDLTELNNTELQQLLQDIVTEQDRRRQLVKIPESVKQMAEAFEQLGGSKQELVDRINEPVVEVGGN